MAFTLCYVAAHLTLELVDEQEAEAILGTARFPRNVLADRPRTSYDQRACPRFTRSAEVPQHGD
jgi:hypothetical protein